MANSETQVPTEIVERLTSLFRRNGYVRWQNADSLKKKGRKYRKGNEVRLVAGSKKEVAEIRKLLVEAGFKPGKPFAKDNQYRLPVYGKKAVARFLELVGFTLVEDEAAD